MGEKPRVRPGKSEDFFSAKAARAAEAAEQIAAGEVVKKPAVDPPAGFNLSKVVRLPSRTSEEIERARQEAEGPRFGTSPGTPRPGADPIHIGGKRRRGGSQD